MIPVFETVCDLLDRGKDLVLATVIGHQGSAPRTAGTQMVIDSGGTGYGTVGGGFLEARVIRESVSALSEGCPRILSFDLACRDAADMDMICGGRVDVLLDIVHPVTEARSLFDRLRRVAHQNETCLFLTVFRQTGERIEGIDRGLVLSGGEVVGCNPFPRSRLAETLDRYRKSPFLDMISREGECIVVQPVTASRTVLLLGAGHVARPTAHLADLVGFRVTVLDDRAEFADRSRFPDAADVRVIPDFDRALADILVDENTFVVIITRGHLHDRTVLARALRTPAAYIGMIGSRTKRDAIFGSLLARGFLRSDLDRVHSPIGLPIQAQTPEEIAVSIVAEMIQVRAGLRK